MSLGGIDFKTIVEGIVCYSNITFFFAFIVSQHYGALACSHANRSRPRACRVAIVEITGHDQPRIRLKHSSHFCRHSSGHRICFISCNKC